MSLIPLKQYSLKVYLDEQEQTEESETPADAGAEEETETPPDIPPPEECPPRTALAQGVELPIMRRVDIRPPGPRALSKMVTSWPRSTAATTMPTARRLDTSARSTAPTTRPRPCRRSAPAPGFQVSTLARSADRDPDLKNPPSRTRVTGAG